MDVENAPKEEADLGAGAAQSLSDVSKQVSDTIGAGNDTEVKHPEETSAGDVGGSEDVTDTVEKVISEGAKPNEAILPVEPSVSEKPEIERPEAETVISEAAGITQRKGRGEEAQKASQEAVQQVDVPKKGSPVEKYADVIAKIMPIAQKGIDLASTAAPYVEQGWEIGKEYYAKLPKNALGAIYGIAICFFGGTYVALIAAIEAYRISGGHDKVMQCVEGIAAELKKVNEVSKKDDEVDDDGDGIPDVQQIDKKELVFRKWALALRTVDPVLLSTAFGGIWTAFIAVIATLQLKFARTVALAVSMGNSLKKPALRFGGKFMKELVPEAYHQWVPFIIETVTKMVTMSIAWYLQRIMSAIQSAISGGLIAARSLLAEANARGYIDMKDEDTMIDEYLGWSVAALGFYFQLMHGFSVPFPFNIILLPMTICEYALQWCVTWMA